jgi:hypothetical protein
MSRFVLDWSNSTLRPLKHQLPRDRRERYSRGVIKMKLKTSIRARIDVEIQPETVRIGK